ncbi:MAG: hypothetical protein QOI96_1370, partial [Verrucomicrobiota bacterium]
MHFYLPLLYDLVGSRKPRLIVTLGFGEGEPHATFCQVVQEQSLKCRCVAIRRGDPQSERHDDAWQKGKAFGEEFYAETAQFLPGPPVDTAQDFGKEDVDLLLIDDCDRGSTVRAELAAWKSKLAADAIVLLHGTQLERKDSPGAAWSEFISHRLHLNFQAGAGLGIATTSSTAKAKGLLATLDARRELYLLTAEKIEAQARAAEVMRENANLETRHVWLACIMEDRSTAQEIMDHQARALKELEGKYEPLRRDREKAQQVMDHQVRVISDLENKFEQLQRDRAEAQQILDHQVRVISGLENSFELLQRDRAEAQQIMDHLEKDREEQNRGVVALRRDRAEAQLVIDAQVEKLSQQAATVGQMYAQIHELSLQIKEQKKILKAAKEACRKKGRCFQIRTEPKIKRSLPEKIVREWRRSARKLGLVASPEAKAPRLKAAPGPVIDLAARYATWIREHEPNPAELEEQRRVAQKWRDRPKISLLVPIHDTPATFLDEMFASVAAQTYDNWELCGVDAGSSNSETLKVLRNWEGRDARLRIERLGQNLGISENTNHALGMARGEFMTCIDHDDLLPPFALYEVARATRKFPQTDLFYSDEDRWNSQGQRHAPFFKPEWSPALLQSSMYLGHLTAYRRDLVTQVGKFRKDFDFSQDYDFALRATEIAREIRHIPSVLYHWREHPGSGSAGGKPNARATNLAALAEAMRRRHLPADILEHPTANRARLKISKWPKVSVIIPTDSPERAQFSLKLPQATNYPDLEIVLVTNSPLVASLKKSRPDDRFRFVCYDKPFNFSDKCNLGAEAATGERLIFFNDDVEPEHADWIQNLIEPLENREVGAVAPKMLYATGNIQHAGLVTGVRGFIGTAFHQRAADSTEHFNLAQSMRDVSALSGACLAMRREDFFRVGGFNAVHTPIANSDLDLCFKIREAGLRCVYTPYATLHHGGHVSLGVEDRKNAARRDKSSIYLLKRWAGYTTHDPYFTDNMRDWLFLDSPTPIKMAGRNQSVVGESSADLLFISHDLSCSGAPMMLLHAATWCQQNGFFVTAMSPKDGPLRHEFEMAGIPLIVDPLILTGHKSLAQFARDFDCVIANTVFSSPIVRALEREKLKVMWWLHETLVGEHYLREDRNLRLALPGAD